MILPATMARAQTELPIQPSTSVTATADAVLRLTPQICVIAKVDTRCHEKLTISWQLPDALSPCLFRSDMTSALQCWYGESRAQLLVDSETDGDLVFELRDSEKVIAVAAFKVLWEEQQRRRRHKPWQFF